MLSPNLDISIKNPSSQGSVSTAEEGQGARVSFGHSRIATLMNPATVTACTTAKAQAKPNPSLEREARH